MGFGDITSFLTGKKSPEQVQAENQQAVAIEEGNIASVSALHEYSQGAKYEADFVKFLQELSENESSTDILNFIKSQQWTTKQQMKIAGYVRVVLGKGVGTTFLSGHSDYLGAIDDLTLIECLLPLGMTTFDVTPEFNMVIAMVNQNFKLNLRRSKGGMFLERIGTQRIEFDRSEARNGQGYRGHKQE